MGIKLKVFHQSHLANPCEECSEKTKTARGSLRNFCVKRIICRQISSGSHSGTSIFAGDASVLSDLFVFSVIVLQTGDVAKQSTVTGWGGGNNVIKLTLYS
jgi:hypothetical protein